jgi:hypothetical protein
VHNEEVILQAWKIALVGAVAVVVTTGAAAHYGFNPFARASSHALAAHQQDSHQQGRPDPITPSETTGEGKASVTEYGWGPFRTTDW